MWHCPKCQTSLTDDFEVCWSCGTTIDGVEDPTFLTADEAEPIEELSVEDIPVADDPADDFAGTAWDELAECYMAENTIEAKFVADQLIAVGIPAIADHQNINLVMGGWKPEMWGYGPKVRVRPADLPKAAKWVHTYVERKLRKRRENEQGYDSEDE
ncbi:MAG: hypothetical protein U0835_17580 [Isosphaeraceae bacterium]